MNCATKTTSTTTKLKTTRTTKRAGVGEAVVFISALYYSYTLRSVGWCPRILLACFALSTMYDLILASLQLVFEVRQRKLECLLTEITARLTPPSERN